MPGTILVVNSALDKVKDVVIDDSGRFKYILCKVYLTDKPSEFKNVVRGTSRAEFHAGIYDDLVDQLENTGMSCLCLGGGKIEHNPQQKSLLVFGLSQGFGAADHSLTVDILKKHYPDYPSITWKDN